MKIPGEKRVGAGAYYYSPPIILYIIFLKKSRAGRLYAPRNFNLKIIKKYVIIKKKTYFLGEFLNKNKDFEEETIF